MKLVVEKYSDTEWEFIYPEEIDNEKTYNPYLEALDYLDYNDVEAEKRLKSLIKKYPSYIDAYSHLSLAFKNLNKRFESYITAEKSYRIGKDCLPKAFKPGKDKLIWLVLDNRPYLRASQIFGLECQDNGEFEHAIQLYDELLLLNESDNQGIRYLKLECLFEMGNFKEAKKLIERYNDSRSIEFAYGKVALAIIDSDYRMAQQLLEGAIKINPFLAEEIKKSKHVPPPPFRLPGEPYFDAGSPVGSIQEAFDYWERNKKLYKQKAIVEFYVQNVSIQN